MFNLALALYSCLCLFLIFFHHSSFIAFVMTMDLPGLSDMTDVFLEISRRSSLCIDLGCTMILDITYGTPWKLACGLRCSLTLDVP